MMRKSLSFILPLILSLNLPAQDVTVKAALDSTDIYLGDQVEYTVTVRQPAGIELIMPDYRDTLHMKLEILSQSEIDTSYDKSGEMILRKSFIITSFDTGYYQIPPFYLEYLTGQGKKRFYSDYVPLRVKRVDIAPPDSTDVIFDIAGPEKVGYGAGEILPWVFLAIAVIIALYLVYKYLPHRKEKPEQTGPPKPGEPIHIITFRELDKLERKGLWQEGKIKEYYTELTDILRYYIEIRYNIPARETTSEEILAGLGGENIQEDQLARLKTILRNADLAKFARYKHDAQTNSLALTDAREFVRATYLREEGTESEGKEVSDE
ncbi:MAG: hypothetical protein RQ743_08485 [Bacteroidales bacterium]|nr:hypothetical protein [Bacteroidales bacterium]